LTSYENEDEDENENENFVQQLKNSKTQKLKNLYCCPLNIKPHK